MARLFVAVRPPAPIVEQIAALPRPAEPGVRWVPPEQWHVTLRFIGEAPVGDAVAALTGLQAEAVDVTLGSRVSRLGRNVVCLPAGGLEHLARQVAELTETLGEPPGPRPFAGHLALARLRHRGACGLAGHPFEARFVAHEIELVRSQLSPAGARHTTELVVGLG